MSNTIPIIRIQNIAKMVCEVKGNCEKKNIEPVVDMIQELTVYYWQIDS